MVNEKAELQKYSRQIQWMNDKGEELSERRIVEIFFSFDIVNSTAYKTLNFTGWAQVITKLFDKIHQMVVKRMPGAELWRLLGDEVVFIVPIREKQDIFVYIDSIFEILNMISFNLKTGTFFDNLEFDTSVCDLMKMQNIISLKASAWIAIVREEVNGIEQYDNLIKRFKLQEGYEIYEFLGNDIDAGFRIKQNTEDRRLVISYELAYILSRNTDYLKNIHIIDYKRLKGIWQNRFYPIIWYHNNKFANGISFEDSFYYDEKENSELVKAYFSNKETPLLESKMYTNVDYALKKILEDQKLMDKLLKIDEIVQQSQNDEKHLLDPGFPMKLHCVAVCFDRAKKKILIMKRADNREKYPGHWEFGCAKGVLEKSFAEQIEEEYKKDFDLKIKIKCNEEREDKQPVPIALYEDINEKGRDKGIIMLAEVVGDVDTEGFQGYKHSEIRWIEEDEIEKFDELAVPDFKETLKMVFNRIK